MPPSTPAKEGVPAEVAVAETAPLVAEPAAATKMDDVRLDVDAVAAAAPCKDRETPISVEFTGNVHPLVINLDKDVGDLQAKVQAATGATPDAQCLTVEGGDGQPLEDETQKLSECVGLESGALVHLTMQDEEQGKARREEREGEHRTWLAGLIVGSFVVAVKLSHETSRHEGRVGVVTWFGAPATFGLSEVNLRWEDGTCSGYTGRDQAELRRPSAAEAAGATVWVAAREVEREALAAAEALAAEAASRREELGLPPTATAAECQAAESKRACCGSAPASFRWAEGFGLTGLGNVCFGIVVVLPPTLAVIFWSTWGKWVAVAAAACVGLACCLRGWLLHNLATS